MTRASRPPAASHSSTGRVHLVGIGGIGTSALASILRARNVEVSGSDLQVSAITDRLAAQGVQITIGHRAELVDGAARVVISDAIKEDNPERQRARAQGIRLQRRSELLGELAADYRLIAVSGTHGKTTMTAMIGLALVAGGLDPTVALGGDYGPLGGNARVGRGEWMVVEACEAYESFLDLHPEIAVVTNLEPEHLDHHGTFAHLRESFATFLGQVRPGGCAVLCADRPELRELATSVSHAVVWYGTEEGAAVRGRGLSTDHSGGRCSLWLSGVEAGELTVGAPGLHNLMNALGAVAAATQTGVEVPACLRALGGFRGVERRFQVLGEANEVTVLDDYAHHPTEIGATIAAARSAFPGRRLIAVFQPHLYSRTRDFAEGFASALSAADVVVLTDIYPAREAPLPGVAVGIITAPLRKLRGQDVVLELPKEKMVTDIVAMVRPGDVILMMGAGDIGEVAHVVYRELAEQAAKRQSQG